MKKRSKKVLFGTVAASSVLLFSACDPAEPVCVYGPPAYFEDSPAVSEDPATEPFVNTPDPAPETTPVGSGFDPAENIPADVYGPPSFWEDEAEPEENEEAEEPEEDTPESGTPYSPKTNVPVCVYGPPRDL